MNKLKTQTKAWREISREGCWLAWCVINNLALLYADIYDRYDETEEGEPTQNKNIEPLAQKKPSSVYRLNSIDYFYSLYTQN